MGIRHSPVGLEGKAFGHVVRQQPEGPAEHQSSPRISIDEAVAQKDPVRRSGRARAGALNDGRKRQGSLHLVCSIGQPTIAQQLADRRNDGHRVEPVRIRAHGISLLRAFGLLCVGAGFWSAKLRMLALRSAGLKHCCTCEVLTGPACERKIGCCDARIRILPTGFSDERHQGSPRIPAEGNPIALRRRCWLDLHRGDRRGGRISSERPVRARQRGL